jgi:hypothetical protein
MLSPMQNALSAEPNSPKASSQVPSNRLLENGPVDHRLMKKIAKAIDRGFHFEGALGVGVKVKSCRERLERSRKPTAAQLNECVIYSEISYRIDQNWMRDPNGGGVTVKMDPKNDGSVERLSTYHHLELENFIIQKFFNGNDGEFDRYFGQRIDEVYKDVSDLIEHRHALTEKTVPLHKT